MSRWVRGIYNSAANFVLSGSLRAASGRTMGRKSKYLSEEPNKSDQHDKSCESSEPSSVTADSCTPATCSCARASSRNGYRIPCACSGTTATSTKRNCTATNYECSCSACRSYAEYLSATDAKGQRIGSRIRDSVESRNFKQTNADSADSIERCTGIPAGVTV